jgi:hypothetical protein
MGEQRQPELPLPTEHAARCHKVSGAALSPRITRGLVVWLGGGERR